MGKPVNLTKDGIKCEEGTVVVSYFTIILMIITAVAYYTNHNVITAIFAVNVIINGLK